MYRGFVLYRSLATKWEIETRKASLHDSIWLSIEVIESSKFRNFGVSRDTEMLLRFHRSSTLSCSVEHHTMRANTRILVARSIRRNLSRSSAIYSKCNKYVQALTTLTVLIWSAIVKKNRMQWLLLWKHLAVTLGFSHGLTYCVKVFHAEKSQDGVVAVPTASTPTQHSTVQCLEWAFCSGIKIPLSHRRLKPVSFFLLPLRGEKPLREKLDWDLTSKTFEKIIIWRFFFNVKIIKLN